MSYMGYMGYMGYLSYMVRVITAGDKVGRVGCLNGKVFRSTKP